MYIVYAYQNKNIHIESKIKMLTQRTKEKYLRRSQYANVYKKGKTKIFIHRKQLKYVHRDVWC